MIDDILQSLFIQAIRAIDLTPTEKKDLRNAIIARTGSQVGSTVRNSSVDRPGE